MTFRLNAGQPCTAWVNYRRTSAHRSSTGKLRASFPAARLYREVHNLGHRQPPPSPMSRFARYDS
jgi:hypothetical protein